MIKKDYQNKAISNFSVAMVWINGGSSEDGEGKKGINKILLSLLGKGCKGFENLEFSDYIDFHGAELNLETLEDGFLISLKSLNEYFYKLYPLIDLIINEPLLSKTQFQSVKKSTINYLKKDKENPFNIAFEKWRKIVYLKHPYAYSPAGYEKDINNIEYNDVLYEYEKFKDKNKYLISNDLRINNKIYNLSNKKTYVKKNNFLQPETKKINRYASTHRESNQVIFMLGNQTCPRSSEEYLTFKVLESHLSYGMSSVLFKLFREKNGLTYDIGVFNPIRQQNCPFLIYLSVSNKNAILAFKILINLWKNLLSILIAENEIDLAKQKLKASLLISNQTLDAVLQRKIQLIGFNIDPDFDFNCSGKIEDITSEDILKITKKYLSKPFLSVYGNKNICKKINDLWMRNF